MILSHSYTRVRLATDQNERGLWKAIRDDPNDEINPLIYRDYLEEKGDPKTETLDPAFQLTRLRHQMGLHVPSHEQYQQLTHHWQQLQHSPHQFPPESPLHHNPSDFRELHDPNLPDPDISYYHLEHSHTGTNPPQDTGRLFSYIGSIFDDFDYLAIGNLRILRNDYNHTYRCTGTWAIPFHMRGNVRQQLVQVEGLSYAQIYEWFRHMIESRILDYLIDQANYDEGVAYDIQLLYVGVSGPSEAQLTQEEFIEKGHGSFYFDFRYLPENPEHMQ